MTFHKIFIYIPMFGSAAVDDVDNAANHLFLDKMIKNYVDRFRK